MLVIRVGDKDDHAGTVTDGSPRTTVGGRIIAVVGSTVVGDNIEGHPSVKTIVASGTANKTTAGGRLVASNGGRVSCGAGLVASQSIVTI